MGPLGSGKTSSMVMECMMMGQGQARDRYGLRRTRGAVVRNTVPELKSTTIKTWLDWVRPQEHGLADIKYDLPISHLLRFEDVEMEVYFIGLDRDDDVKKLKSLELSWIWFHEASEITEDIFKMGTLRVDRFPGKRDGGCTRPAVIMDYNAVDSDHWLYKLAEESKPRNAAFFRQPPALLEDPAGTIESVQGTRYRVNPEADNLENLSKNYYPNGGEGKEDSWIKVFLCNQYGFIQSGRPVHPAYRDNVHFAEKELPVYKGLPLLLGFDFGLNPSCAFTQFTPRGQLRVIDELCGEGGVEQFIHEQLIPHIAQWYAGMEIHGWGDPAGGEPSPTNEKTCFMALREAGFDILPAPVPGNDFGMRKLALDKFLSRLVDGEPAILLSDRCRTIRAGLAGKYRFARKRVPGESGIFRDEPVKNIYCVDLQTEALTPDGWKTYDQLNPGQHIIVMNESAEKLTRGHVEAVNIFEGPQEAIRLHNAGSEFVFTANHRQFIETQDGVRKFCRTHELRDGHSFLHPPSEARHPKQEFFSDRFISIAAWVSAEGSLAPDRKAWLLCQSKSANPRYIAHLDALFGHDPCVIRHETELRMQTWRITKELALLLHRYQPQKIPAPDFIMMMSNRQRRLYIYEFLRGDGNVSNGVADTYMPDKKDIGRSRDFFVTGQAHRFFQKSTARVDAIQMMGALCGLPVVLHPVQTMHGPGWSGTIRRTRRLNFHGMKAEGVITDGVWCPTTATGSWVMRRAGKVLVTGNSHICEGLQYAALGITGGGDRKDKDLLAVVRQYNQSQKPLDSHAGY